MTILNVPEAVAIAATPGSEESALGTETLILVIRENIYIPTGFSNKNQFRYIFMEARPSCCLLCYLIFAPFSAIFSPGTGKIS